MTGVLGVIGDIAEDVTVHANAPFAPGSDTHCRIERRRGGSAANVAVAAAALTSSRFIGCLGDDPAGAMLAGGLTGVDARLQITPDAPSGTIVVIVEQTGERHMFPSRGANSYLTTLDAGWLDGLAWLHATAYSLVGPGTTPAVVRAALARHSQPTSIDVSSRGLIEHFRVDRFAALIDGLAPDVVFANADEGEVLGWDDDQPSDRVIVIKHGHDPVLVRTPAGAWRFPVSRVEPTDTTGAGDAFAAGALAHLLERQALPVTEADAAELVRAGHATALRWLAR